MSDTFRFPSLAEANRSRRRAVETWFRGDVLNTAEGWSVSRADPGEMLAFFPSLLLAEEYRLVGYQYRQGDSGNGRVLALPNTAEPEDFVPAEGAPAGPAAPVDVMPHVRGDGTAESYFAASLFWRECQEFGAWGHGTSWLDHHLLANECWAPVSAAIISHTGEEVVLQREDWQWLEEAPADFRPSLQSDAEARTMAFYTYHGRSDPKIVRHIDRYPPSGYLLASAAEVIAVA